jgi:hypothetical protein
MTHVLTDSEYDEYLKVKLELAQLREFKKDFLDNCKEYFEEHKKEIPCGGCNTTEYICEGCPIGELTPFGPMIHWPGTCPLGYERSYGK